MTKIADLMNSVKSLYHNYGSEVGLAAKLVVRALVPWERVAEAVEDIFEYSSDKQQERALNKISERIESIGGDADFLLSIMRNLKGELKPLLEETLTEVQAGAFDRFAGHLQQRINEHHIEIRDLLRAQMIQQYSLNDDLKRLLEGQRVHEAQIQKLLVAIQGYFAESDPIEDQTIPDEELSRYRQMRGRFDSALLSARLHQAGEALEEMRKLCTDDSMLQQSQDVLNVAKETLAQSAQWKIGSQFWEPISQLGEGGMGTVWKARNTFDQIAALKLIRDDHSHKEEYQEKFRSEITALMKIDHPSVVKIIDKGWDAESLQWFLVMELIEGITLRNHLGQHGRMSSTAVRTLAINIAGGLAECHGQDIIHRDIKPGNILLTEDHHPIIIDFGISGQAQNIGETRVGTFKYASPEQHRGERLTQHSDLYSLGVLLEECLADAHDQQLNQMIKRLKSKHPTERGSATQVVAVLSGRQDISPHEHPDPQLRVSRRVLTEAEKDHKTQTFNQVLSYALKYLKREVSHDDLRHHVKSSLDAGLRPHELPIEVLRATFRSGDLFSQKVAETTLRERYIEGPPHLEPYLMLETLVTQSLFFNITGNQPSFFRLSAADMIDQIEHYKRSQVPLGNTLPVEQVSWEAAAMFCNQLSQLYSLAPAYKSKSGVLKLDIQSEGFRLPHEAEWEFAARAGTAFIFAGSNDLDRVGWYRSNAFGRTHRVKEKKKNKYGLYDMSGNLWELCEDRYYPEGLKRSPKSEYRVCRGGSVHTKHENCRIDARVAYTNQAHRFIGFRVVRSLGKLN